MTRKYVKTAKLKTTKVYVSNSLYLQFFKRVPIGESTVIDKMRNLTPVKKGKGTTRVIPSITDTEWNELYQRVAKVRASILGCDRQTELVPALSAKVMARRMEALGVDNPVFYETKDEKAKRESKETAYTPMATPSTEVDSTPNQITLTTADDVVGVSDDELAGFQQDLKLGTNY